MFLVAHSHRIAAPALGELPDRARRVARRLASGERAALAAALEVTSGVMPAGAVLVVAAPATAPSSHLLESAARAGAAFAASAGHAFRSDPTFVVEMMDNTLLTALTIACGFDGDAVSLGASTGQREAALELARARLDDGAAEVVVVAAGETAGIAMRLVASVPGRGPAARAALIAALDRGVGA